VSAVADHRPAPTAGRPFVSKVLSIAASGSQEPTVTRAYDTNCQAADPVNSRWALILGGGTQPQPLYCTSSTLTGNSLP
jgi:hypothetical protein